MGHVEQYARAYARTRVCVLVSKPSICTIRTVLGTCTRVRVLGGKLTICTVFRTCNARTRARSDPYKSSQARYSAWDSGASFTGNRLQG